MSIKNNLGAILFWSVISAAFIGPGTVTTAASAGAGYGLDLIWVLVVSTFACIILQVNVTRITITNEKTIGELLLAKFEKFRFIPVLLGISIVFGCAAYQAGNLLGASLGVSLLFDLDPKWVLLFIVVLASTLLWFGSMQAVVRILGSIVALMGATFIIIAFTIDFNYAELFGASFIPKVPLGSEIIVMGLIGTTIVPYNLFLGSGLSKGKKLSASIFGLILAISLGGVISIAILIVGTLVHEPFSFEKLSAVLSSDFGSWSNFLLGIGLFAAGFTSAMTAPLAAVFTLKSVFPNQNKPIITRGTWMVVMGSGLIFGFFNIKPIPAIILAQAINGIILPFIAVFILHIASFKKGKLSLGRSFFDMLILYLVVFLIVVIGVFNVLKLLFNPGDILIVSAIAAGILVVSAVLFLSIIANRKARI